MKLRLAGATLLMLLAACAQKPTRISETTARPYDQLVAKAHQPVQITDDTVILDARGAFDYGLSHVARSIHFTWDQLAQSRDDGEVIRDLRRAGERLALVGVRPGVPVVVVGEAPAGDGGDARLAWTLLRLGIERRALRHPRVAARVLVARTSALPKNAPAWMPTPVTALELDAAELKTLASSLSDLKAKRTWLIDVRTPAEYLKKFSIAGTVNVPWTEFYAKDGRPNPRIRATLSKVGIEADDRLVMISPRGVRAGAAAFALMAQGFPTVQVMRL